MTKVFGQVYADAYDAIYGEKDYAGECDLLESIFSSSSRPVRRVLDLGCGTGNHTLRLASRGYQVAGVDRSAEMLRVARTKAEEGALSVDLWEGDIRSARLNQTFDAVLLMFAVLGYQSENLDILSTLQTARAHLESDGLLIFDVWYGPAVLSQRPGERVRLYENDNGRILRWSRGELDVRRQLCAVHYHVWQFDSQQSAIETTETHTMRFFFESELALFLGIAGFKLESISAFPNINAPPAEDTWNILVTATAV